MSDNRCGTCRWWSQTSEDAGNCISRKVMGQPFERDAMWSELYGGPTVTGPLFGCIHHELREECRYALPPGTL